MYEVLSVWDEFGTDDGEPAVIRDYGEQWRAADKVMFSTTLDAVSTRRTRLERSFDPEAIGRMKADAASDISIGGPTLATAAIAAGLVDDWHLFLTPIVVGGGTPFLPADVRQRLALVSERRFASGVVHLHYRSA
jgi:dihydrofolate reductase